MIDWETIHLEINERKIEGMAPLAVWIDGNGKLTWLPSNAIFQTQLGWLKI